MESRLQSKLDLIAHLRARRYELLERKLNKLQRSFEAGTTTDRPVNRGFGAFAFADPSLELLLKEWITLNPNSFIPHVARGVYYEHLAWISRGVDFSHRTPKIRFSEMRRYLAKARNDFETALTLNPQLPAAYRFFIRSLSGLGHFKEAQKVFEIAQRELPNGRAHLWTYAVYSAPHWSGMRDAQSQFLATAEALRYRDRRYDVIAGFADYAEGRRLERRKKYDEAAKYFDRAIAANNDQAAFYYERAGNAWLRDRDAAALQDAARALEHAPDDSFTHGLVARIYLHQKNFEKALIHSGRAIARDPYHPAHLLLRVRIRREMKAFDKAAPDLKRAMRYGANEAHVHAEQARYFQVVARDPAKAKNAWRRTTELAPHENGYWLSYLSHLRSNRDCGAVEAAANYLRACLSRESCKASQVMHTSILTNNTIDKAQCPYKKHHIANQFRRWLNAKDLELLERSKKHAAYPRGDRPVAGKSHPRRMTLEGLRLGMTESDVRRVYPKIEIHRSYLSDRKTVYVAVGKAKSHDGARDVNVIFSHFGTVETVHSAGETVVEAAPHMIARKIEELRRTLTAPYGKPDREITNEVNGKHLMEFRQTNDKLEVVASFSIEQHPAKILRKNADSVVYAIKIHKALVDLELSARSKKAIDRLAARERGKGP